MGEKPLATRAAQYQAAEPRPQEAVVLMLSYVARH
jgi:hypothetical protein